MARQQASLNWDRLVAVSTVQAYCFKHQLMWHAFISPLFFNFYSILILFFKGSWERPFNNLNTRDDDFFLDAKNSVKVKMMHQNKVFNVHRDEKLSCWVVEIPYKGNVTALFVLPDKETMKQVEDALLKETVSNWLRALEKR